MGTPDSTPEKRFPGKPPSRPPSERSKPRQPASRSPLRLTPIAGRPGAHELVHPKCVDETRLDFEEGLEIWKAGEPEEARDALRFALQGCGDNLWIHVALGMIALREFKDPQLASGHFGYAVDLGQRAVPPEFSGRIPRDRESNRPFFEAIDGLIQCLKALGKEKDASSLADLAERLDPRSSNRSGPQGRPPGGPSSGPRRGPSRGGGPPRGPRNPGR